MHDEWWHPLSTPTSSPKAVKYHSLVHKIACLQLVIKEMVNISPTGMLFPIQIISKQAIRKNFDWICVVFENHIFCIFRNMRAISQYEGKIRTAL